MNLLRKITQQKNVSVKNPVIRRVSDPHHFNADPVSAFQFNADTDPHQSDGKSATADVENL